MRKVAVVATLLLALLAVADGVPAASCLGYMTQVEPFAFETVTVSTTAIGFTAATYAPSVTRKASYAIISVEAQPIRYRVDGSNPTSAVGHPAVANDQLEVCGISAVTNFRAIRSGGTDSSLSVTFYTGQ